MDNNNNNDKKMMYKNKQTKQTHTNKPLVIVATTWFVHLRIALYQVCRSDSFFPVCYCICLFCCFLSRCRMRPNTKIYCYRTNKQKKQTIIILTKPLFLGLMFFQGLNLYRDQDASRSSCEILLFVFVFCLFTFLLVRLFDCLFVRLFSILIFRNTTTRNNGWVAKEKKTQER